MAPVLAPVRPAVSTLAKARESIRVPTIVVNATTVYWTDAGACSTDAGLSCSGAVRSALKNGGSPKSLAAGLVNPAGIALDSTSVYWVNAGVCNVDGGISCQDGTVMKMPLGGGEPTTIASGQGKPVGIVVDSTSVYWTNEASGTVMKATPK